MKWSPSQTTWRTNVKQIIYHSSDYIWDDFPTLAIFRCFCPFRIRPMYFYLSDVIMSMVSSDLHHQVKVSWGKRLGNSDKTPLEPMEALISIEGQKQKVWSCYIKLRLNCVYPLLLSLNPVCGGWGGREGGREGGKAGKKGKLRELCCWIARQQSQGTPSDEQTVPQATALPFPPHLTRNSRRGRTRKRVNEHLSMFNAPKSKAQMAIPWAPGFTLPPTR